MLTEFNMKKYIFEEIMKLMQTTNPRKKANIRRLLAGVLAAMLMLSPMVAYADTDKPAIKTSNYVIRDMSDARNALETLARKAPINACIYLKESYTIREEADPYSASVATLASGQSVNITSVGADEGRNIWYKVTVGTAMGTFTGYAEREFVACADARFVEWADKYITTTGREEVASTTNCEDIEMFPEEYKDKLYALKKTHPEWIFVKTATNLDWSKSVSAEGKGDISLIYTKGSPTSYIEASYGDNVWSYASDGIIAYYMDPRNFLTEEQVFQFEQLSYNSEYHSESSVQQILNGTFMEGNVEGTSTRYATAFMNYGARYKVSPIMQAARVYSEQGKNGSTLISGTYPGYENLYNYYNVKASGATQKECIINGLTYAREKGWNTRLKALEGGASFLSSNYISKGQDTYYFQKFNVSSTYYAPYTHQYMQDISAARKNATSSYKSYSNSGLTKGTAFVFRIPVYNNMPSGTCNKPDAKDTLSLDITTVENLPVDGSAVIRTLINGGANLNYDVSFTSDNTSVAEVSEQGVITGRKPGKATITVSADSINSATCSVNVIKADISVDDAALEPIDITHDPNRTLRDIELPDGYSFANPDTVPTVTNEGYTVNYAPDESKYNSISMNVTINVAKATISADELSLPDDLECNVSTELSSIPLPENYSWVDGGSTVSSRAGVYTYKANYCPDYDNYEVLKDIEISVKVNCVEHNFSDWSISGNVKTRHCLNCDVTESLDIVDEVDDDDCLTNGHNMVDGVCANCGYKEPTVDEHIHSYTESGDTATCEEDGVKTFTCSCGDSYTEPSKAKGHSYLKGVCENCGASIEVTPAITAIPSTIPEKSPSPSVAPTNKPAATEAVTPAVTKTPSPTVTPTPTSEPTKAPTPTPSKSVVPEITKLVTPTPTSVPTSEPTKVPSPTPSKVVVPEITKLVTPTPTSAPTAAPTKAPTPTSEPTKAPTPTVTKTPTPTTTPTTAPTNAPTTAGGNDNNNNATGNTNTTSEGSTGTIALPTIVPLPSAANGNQAIGGAGGAGNTAGGAATGNNTTAETANGAGNTANTNPTDADLTEPDDYGIDPVTGLPIGEDGSASGNDGSEAGSSHDTVKPVIELENNTVITGETLKNMGISGEVELKLDNGVTWDIDLTGADMEALSIDLQVDLGNAAVPEEVIDKLDCDEYMLMSLSHDGEFGFRVKLAVPIPESEQGRYANLYYYNPVTKKTELVDSVLVTDQTATFSMSHASDYVITFTDRQQVVGNGMNVMMIILIVLIVVVGLGVLGFLLWKLRAIPIENDYFDEEDNSLT